jgi:hypothetical protein
MNVMDVQLVEVATQRVSLFSQLLDVLCMELCPQGTSINSNLVENSYGRAALSAFVCLQ